LTLELKNNLNKKWDLIITPQRGLFELHLSEIWKYRDLLYLFIKRDFTTFYKQTILGPLWFIIQPFISTIIFSFIFNRVAKIPTEEIPPYLFYLSGIIAWNYFSECLTTTSNTFTSNVNIFGKVYFPRIIMPLSKVISGLIKFFIQFVLFLGLYIYYVLLGNQSMAPSFYLIIVPILIFQMALLGQGLGMIISSLTTKYRDLSYILNFGIQLLMYASPIVYPLSIVPEKYRLIIISNPMTPIIEIFRNALLGTGQINMIMYIYSIVMTLVLFIIGLIIFNKVEKSFIDTV
tara:strand:+ start:68 stop:937 length:870 start_codon:yes stop_codon:yes gene_type:complete